MEFWSEKQTVDTYLNFKRVRNCAYMAWHSPLNDLNVSLHSKTGAKRWLCSFRLARTPHSFWKVPALFVGALLPEICTTMEPLNKIHLIFDAPRLDLYFCQSNKPKSVSSFSHYFFFLALLFRFIILMLKGILCNQWLNLRTMCVQYMY